MNNPPPSKDGHEPITDASQPETKQETNVDYPTTQKRILIMASLYLAIFLVTLVLYCFRYLPVIDC